MGNLVRSIQINRAKFSHCSFAHIDRKAIRVAHELTTLAHSIPNCIWMEDIHTNIVPNFLLSLWTSSNIIATFIKKNNNNDSGGVKVCG
jgi:hypothetical protein